MKTKKKLLSTYVSEETYNNIKKLVIEKNLNISSFIASAIKDKLDKLET